MSEVFGVIRTLHRMSFLAWVGLASLSVVCKLAQL
jgi:hypothetical protein